MDKRCGVRAPEEDAEEMNAGLKEWIQRTIDDHPTREERNKRTEERLEALEQRAGNLENAARQLQASIEDMESKYIDIQAELERLTYLLTPDDIL